MAKALNPCAGTSSLHTTCYHLYLYNTGRRAPSATSSRPAIIGQRVIHPILTPPTPQPGTFLDIKRWHRLARRPRLSSPRAARCRGLKIGAEFVCMPQRDLKIERELRVPEKTQRDILRKHS